MLAQMICRATFESQYGISHAAFRPIRKATIPEQAKK